MVESSSSPFAANEVSAGFSIPDLPAGAGFTALCDGVCDTAACSNLLDYVERQDGATVPTAPACANFAPSSIESAGQVVTFRCSEVLLLARPVPITSKPLIGSLALPPETSNSGYSSDMVRL